MARATEHRGKLIGCPTCGTKVKDIDIGLRDFRWVNEALPGKVGLMDIDGCITQAATGRALMMELKPKDDVVSTGARLTYALFRNLGIEVWLAWDEGDGWVKVCEMMVDGSWGRARKMRRTTLARHVREWWDEGL
jgi:hypothetical protein